MYIFNLIPKPKTIILAITTHNHREVAIHNLILLVGIDSVQVATLHASLDRATCPIAIRLVMLVEVHVCAVHAIHLGINGNELTSVPIIPSDLIFGAHKNLMSWACNHSALLFGDGMRDNAERVLEIFIILPLYILSSCLGRVWTVRTTYCLGAVALFQLDKNLSHVWSSDENVMISWVVTTEGDATDAVQPEILAPLVDESSTVALILKNRILAGNIQVAAHPLLAEWVKLNIHWAEQSWTTGGEYPLWGTCSGIVPNNPVLVVFSDVDRLLEVFDCARGSRNTTEGRLLQHSILSVVEDDLFCPLACDVKLVAVIPACVPASSVVVVPEVKPHWILQSTTSLLDEIGARCIRPAFHHPVVRVVGNEDETKIQIWIVNHSWGSVDVGPHIHVVLCCHSSC